MCISVLFWSIGLAGASDSEIVPRFRELTQSSRWKLERETNVKFRTYHPQGMTRIDDRLYVTSVEVIDRAKGQGKGHLFEMDLEGNLLRETMLGEGPMYHPGGIDYDGKRIWVSVAEYRPDSRSIIYTVDPATMCAEKAFAFDDHLGAILHDTARRSLVGISWGSRRFYRWPMAKKGGRWRPVDPEHPARLLNGSHYVDYQDNQALHGTKYALFGGVKGYRAPKGTGRSFSLGGIDLVDLETLQPVHQVPVPLWAKSGRVMTQNPFLVEAAGEGLRFYFMPDDDRSTLYVYTAK